MRLDPELLLREYAARIRIAASHAREGDKSRAAHNECSADELLAALRKELGREEADRRVGEWLRTKGVSASPFIAVARYRMLCADYGRRSTPSTEGEFRKAVKRYGLEEALRRVIAKWGPSSSSQRRKEPAPTPTKSKRASENAAANPMAVVRAARAGDPKAIAQYNMHRRALWDRIDALSKGPERNKLQREAFKKHLPRPYYEPPVKGPTASEVVMVHRLQQAFSDEAHARRELPREVLEVRHGPLETKAERKAEEDELRREFAKLTTRLTRLVRKAAAPAIRDAVTAMRSCADDLDEATRQRAAATKNKEYADAVGGRLTSLPGEYRGD